GIGCFTTADLLAGRAVVRTATASPTMTAGDARGSDAITLPNPESGTMDFYGLVPDGIFRVELGDRSAPVQNNLFHLRGPESLSSEPIRMITSARGGGS